MHEMALAEGILSVVLDAAEGQKVRRINLRVGKLQMVVPDSLRFSFQLVAEGTIASDAAINLEEYPLSVLCRQCGSRSEVDLPFLICGSCGSPDIEVVSGDEILVDSVELENDQVICRREAPAEEFLEQHLKEHELHDLAHDKGVR